MKLYAQTTSERASKGQGGNDKVLVELTIDPVARKMIGRLSMTCEKLNATTDLYSVYYYPINVECVKQKLQGGRVLLYQEEITKGKKQKGAIKAYCTAGHDDYTSGCKDCSDNIPF